MSASTETATYCSAAGHVANHDYQSAIRELTSALAQHPDAGRLWELRGQVHLADNDPVDAVSCLEHAQCLVPLSPESEFALAQGYERTGKRQPACEMLKALARRDDLPLNVLEPLARALGRHRKPQLALSICRQAASRMPDMPAPLLGMVFYQRRLGLPPEQMLPVLFRAFHLEPEDFTIRLTLARMLHESDRSTEAAQLLSVVALDSTRCPNCLSAMQAIFEDACDHERAHRCAELRAAIESDGKA
ncbi:MAG: tetratricopeptide repeat protein [Planctomycetota bacterium]